MEDPIAVLRQESRRLRLIQLRVLQLRQVSDQLQVGLEHLARLTALKEPDGKKS